MKLKKLIAVLLLASATLFSSFLQCAYAQQRGPRTDDLAIYPYSLSYNCFQALVTGEIDVMAWPLTASQYHDAISDPNIVLAPYSGNDMFGFPFNLNETIKTYSHLSPALVSPMTYLEFRQAIAYLVDKDWAVDTACGGWAKRIDVPVPYAQQAYWNTSVTYPYYPYEYDPAAAKSMLDSKFPVGTTPNTYYDPGDPLSSQFLRQYPADHNYTGTDLHPIVFCARTDQSSQHQVALYLRDNMRKLGIPVDFLEGNAYQLYNRVVEEKDFHIFTGGQFTWMYPVVFVYFGLSIMQQFLGLRPSSIAEGVRDYIISMQGGKIEQYLNESRKSWESPTFTESLAHSSQAQGRYVEAALGIPLWSSYSYIAYRKELLGVVNLQGYGIVNEYTFLNAYKQDSSPIRIGLVSDPYQMNVMHSHWYSDYQVLDAIYSDLIGFAPYNTASDQPWIVQDWSTGTWTNPETGKACCVVDYWFRKDVYAAQPITGDQGPQLTAYDYEFSSHFIYAQGYEGYLHTPHWGRFKDIYNVTVIDAYHVKVFMNITSYWALNAPVYPIVPKSVWLREPLAHNHGAYFEAGANITLPGTVPLTKRVVSGSADTIIIVKLTDGNLKELVWGRDYAWKMGNLIIKINSVDGVNISKVWVDYWTYGNTGGYYPGELDWAETLVGFGPYYVSTITPGVGGAVGLKRNPFFFMETPLLGEVDWSWKWVAGAKPRDGYFKVDIYDLVLVGGAYGSQGTGVPSTNWFPGADLAAAGGVINIYDMVTVSGVNWDGEFGHPPP